MGDSPKHKDGWDKADIVGKWAIALAVAAFAYFSNSALIQRQTDAKMVELAVAILRNSPEKESEPLRAWAIDVFVKCSPRPVSGEMQALLRNEKLPTYLTTGDGDFITTGSSDRMIVNPKAPNK